MDANNCELGMSNQYCYSAHNIRIGRFLCEYREMPPVMQRGTELFDGKNPDAGETDKKRSISAKLQLFAYEVSIIGIRFALCMASYLIHSDRIVFSDNCIVCYWARNTFISNFI